MAFITVEGNVTSFADFQDAKDRDARVFELNEGLLDDDVVINKLLERATERILTKLSASEWWIGYFMFRKSINMRTVADIPPLNANYIKGRQNDFSDLCVYTAFAEFILPKVADFGNEDNAEVKKMEYYEDKAESLYNELVAAGDWYDLDGSGVVTSWEKEPYYNDMRFVR